MANTKDEYPNWLAGLKVGDDVILEEQFRVRRGVVDRATRTIVGVGGVGYTRATGYRRGRDARDGLVWLARPTPQLVESARRQAACEELRRAAGPHASLDDVPTGALERAVAALRERATGPAVPSPLSTGTADSEGPASGRTRNPH
jgi:hypothetical protein